MGGGRLQHPAHRAAGLPRTCNPVESGALALVFGLFQGMVFGRLVQRHTARIRGYGTERKWFWQFFDGKSFLIMVFMMAFGIGLRASGLAPEGFIAVFYTGLGASLLTAGLRFLLAVSRG